MCDKSLVETPNILQSLGGRIFLMYFTEICSLFITEAIHTLFDLFPVTAGFIGMVIEPCTTVHTIAGHCLLKYFDGSNQEGDVESFTWPFSRICCLSICDKLTPNGRTWGITCATRTSETAVNDISFLSDFRK